MKSNSHWLASENFPFICSQDMNNEKEVLLLLTGVMYFISA